MIKNVLLYIALTLGVVLIGCSDDLPNDKENGKKEPLSIDVVVSSESIIYNGVETSILATFSENVDEAVFYFDGVSIGSVISAPYSVKFTASDLPPKEYKITCVAKVGGESFTGEKSVSVALRLGDSFQGGKIFQLDTSGKKGLVASATDLVHIGDFGDEVRFCWGGEGLLGTSIDNGKANTKLMADASTSPGFAGYHFKGGGLNLNGYSDWYIPSYRELEVLKENKSLVGGFSTDTDWNAMYWSSSESSESSALILNFNVLMGNYDDKGKYYKVRPIRSFDFSDGNS